MLEIIIPTPANQVNIIYNIALDLAWLSIPTHVPSAYFSVLPPISN